MGKKLDALLGRSFKSGKFKPVVNLAISRLAVLKNQRQVRCNQARSDVVQLLQQGHYDRALLRVEQVMKEQNMLDVFVMMEGYCSLLLERVHLFERARECPDELKEAVSSLLFASTRCGEFPELQEIRAQIGSRYGKEFVARAVELRNNCGVNTKIIQKLSTRQPELENRRKVINEIAAENGIVLQLDEASSSAQENMGENKKQNKAELEKLANLDIPLEEIENEGYSDSVKRKKYRDVADAAQAAFKSAAYAASAARAAVELSRSNPQNPDDQDNSNGGRKVSDKDGLGSKLKNKESIYDESAELKGKNVLEMDRTGSTSSSDSDDGELKGSTMSTEEGEMFNERNNDGVNTESSMLKRGGLAAENSYKQIPSIIQTGIEVDKGSGHSTGHPAEESAIRSSKVLNLKRGPFSVRTRQVRGY